MKGIYNNELADYAVTQIERLEQCKDWYEFHDMIYGVLAEEWILAHASIVEEELGPDYMDKIRRCGAEDCGLFFWDDSIEQVLWTKSKKLRSVINYIICL